MKRVTFRFGLWLLMVGGAAIQPALTHVALAQQEPQSPFLDLTEAQFVNEGNLRKWPGVSVSVTRAQLDANDIARNALLEYVRDGGVVCLHTDAATLFDYVTLPAADVLPDDVAIAQSICPFGAHPLLSSNGGSNFVGQVPGVHEIAFKVGPDDAVVVSQPNATGLMRVKNVQTPDGRAIYALAIAPFGRGWAIFSPYDISEYGDGPTLIRNLENFARPAGKGYVPLSMKAIVAATEQGDTQPLKDSLQDVAPADAPAATPPGTAPVTQPPNALTPIGALAAAPDNPLEVVPATPNLAEAKPAAADDQTETPPKLEDVPPPVADPALQVRRDEISLPLAPGEADQLLKDLKVGARHASATLALLRVRTEYLRGDAPEALRWLRFASEQEPGQSAIAIWKGILAIQNLEDDSLNRGPAERASILNEAAGNWQIALEMSQVQNPVPTQPATTAGQPPPDVFVGGVFRPVVIDWCNSAKREVPYGAITPSQQVPIRGNQSNLILNSVPGDPAANKVARALQILANARSYPRSTSVLIFPNAETYQRYADQGGLDHGATESIVYEWWVANQLGILLPGNSTGDRNRYSSELAARLKMADMNFNWGVYRFLLYSHLQTLVRTTDSVKPAYEFFGTSWFEALRASYMQG